MYRGCLQCLFPQNCIYCREPRGGPGEFLCELCLREVGGIQSPYCSRCGLPAEISYDFPTEDFTCAACRKRPFDFDRARSLGRYDTVLKELICHLKYQRQPGAMADIASLLKDHFFTLPEGAYRDFTVSPIPLHFRKMKDRSFDQGFLIAQEVARTLRLPFANGVLRRVKETDSLAGMTKAERWKNIRGVFEVDRPERVQGKDILLVDDVFTTGATGNEAARMLKKSQAGQVHVFTLARTI